ncbi:MAG: SAM-dependent methyltransferase [Chloroflexota bacterium]
MEEKQYPNHPSSARMYDYWLGGQNYFPIDQAAADHITAQIPSAPYFAVMNRDFLRRAVQWLTANGIDQFLDLGSGIPTMNNVHETAQQINPDARVVYVDNDPVAIAQSRNVLGTNATTAAILADVRDTDTILTHPETTQTLDFSRPVAVMCVSMLHFIPDTDEVHRCLQTFRDTSTTGSYLVISHGVVPETLSEEQRKMQLGHVQKAYQRDGFTERCLSEVAQLFTGYDLMPPGLVPLHEWHPDEQTPVHNPEYGNGMYGGIGVRRE